MKTLEAKPFDQNAENWKRENLDCLHRPCSRPVPRGKIESVRTHSEVIEQFDSFSLLKLLFLVRNWHRWSRKVFHRQMTPQSREKLQNRPFFDIVDSHEKLYGRSWLYASDQRRHGTVLSLFSSLSFDISMKNSVQRWSSDVQGLVRVKSGKCRWEQWSLHAPLNVLSHTCSCQIGLFT